MLFSHVFGVFLFTGINLYVGSLWLVRRPLDGVDFLSWVISEACALVVFSYWGWLLFGMSSTVATWIPELGIYRFFLELGLLFNGPVSAVVMCSLALFMIYQWLVRPLIDREIPRADAWEDGLVLVWLASPILIAAIVSELASHAEPGDTLIVHKFVYPTVHYYWRDPVIEIEIAKERPDVQSLLRERGRVWVVQWKNFSQDSLFKTGERIGSHQVVRSSKARKVELFLLTRVNSG